jgi:peroxiredoxin Q/BCP
VFVVDKSGKVLAAEPGGPDATVEVVRKLVGGGTGNVEKDEDVEVAKTADEVADTAAKVDA